VPDLLNLGHQFRISLLPLAQQERFPGVRGVSTFRRRGNFQGFGDRLDPADGAVAVDEHVRHLSRLSSSALAENALASFRILLARRNSLTSRSGSLMRCASAVVMP
jgi:hypothetical protein